MQAIIYTFEIYPEKEAQFIDAWAKMTELIKKYEGGLGSRLHKVNETHFVAYAQWPSEEMWKNFGSKLSPEAKEFSRLMNDACKKSDTLYSMETVSDLLEK